MQITFHTQGGPRKVKTTDQKLIDFIKWAKTFRNGYGHRPKHPLDYIEIAEQLYYVDGWISEADCSYYRKAFTDIILNFKKDAV